MNKAIVIAGPTGVGKTKISIDLAKKLNAEIISSDSAQVYRGLNIGTAKIREEEKEGIKHHLIDIVEPVLKYSVGNFEKDANLLSLTPLSRVDIPFLIFNFSKFILDSSSSDVTLLLGSACPAPIILA